jgi:formylglycine-generating enzyme required for sulfatase activity
MNFPSIILNLAVWTIAFLVSPAFAVVNMVYVDVGHAGNAADPSTGFGAVATSYKIGKYEVTNSQYAEFLNAKGASNTNDIFGYTAIPRGIVQSGVSGSFSYSVRSGFENRPVNYVTWYSAARFINWLGNGQGDGDMETGAYTLTGNTGIISVNPGASIYNPTEDEWYKAAYYNGATSSYSLYPHGLDSITTADANFDGSASKVVGSYSGDASFYGTFDQGGNVWEWNDAVIGSTRGLRGGSYLGSERGLRSSDSFNFDPAVGFENAGFRVASVPEPTSAFLALIAGSLIITRRKRYSSTIP